MKNRYDATLIDAHIQRVHGEVGDHPFTSLGIMALEALMRAHDPNDKLPGRTLLRERLNAFRMARWPTLAPKKVPRYW